MSGGLPYLPGDLPYADRHESAAPHANDGHGHGLELPRPGMSEPERTTNSFFDRSPPADYLSEWAKRLAQPEKQAERDLHSVVIFRLNSEWLAMDTAYLVEITDTHIVHSIPHRTNPVLLGLVNIRGQLRLCVSLHGLLNVGAAPPDVTAAARVGLPGTPGRTSYTRMVILEHGADQWVFIADEVLGVKRFSASQFRKVPSTYQQTNSHTQTVFDWDGHTVGHLDAERLVTSLRSHCQ